MWNRKIPTHNVRLCSEFGNWAFSILGAWSLHQNPNSELLRVGSTLFGVFISRFGLIVCTLLTPDSLNSEFQTAAFRNARSECTITVGLFPFGCVPLLWIRPPDRMPVVWSPPFCSDFRNRTGRKVYSILVCPNLPIPNSERLFSKVELPTLLNLASRLNAYH